MERNNTWHGRELSDVLELDLARLPELQKLADQESRSQLATYFASEHNAYAQTAQAINAYRSDAAAYRTAVDRNTLMAGFPVPGYAGKR